MSQKSVLILTNLYPFPWHKNRGVFNYQQFQVVGDKARLTVAVPVPFMQALKHPVQYLRALRNRQPGTVRVKYFVSLYIPKYFHQLRPLSMFLSLAVQRPFLCFFERWDALLGSWLYPDAIAIGMLAKLRGLPFLAKAHGSDVNDYLERGDRNKQIVSVLNQSAGVIVVSKALGDKLLAAGVSAGLPSVVYNGVNLDLFSPMEKAPARAKLSLPDDIKIILFVGNLIPSKGIDDLLASIGIIARHRQDFLLCLLGSAPDRSRLEKLVDSHGIEKFVKFVGNVGHGDLPTWYGSADLLCLPSHNEGVPNVILEALASGRAVVATRVGGIPEILHDEAGVLVDPGAPESLARGLSDALDKSWSAAGIRHSVEDFSWQKSADGILRIIDKACTK